MINHVSATPTEPSDRKRAVVLDVMDTDALTTFRARMTISAARTLRDELATAIAILEERVAASGGG
jgi:hypothetical protein